MEEEEERKRYEKNMERIRAQRRTEAKKQSPPSYADSQRMEAAKNKKGS